MIMFSVLCPPSVIYHYCVIVEMFCIGLYARHTFRKVEPSVVEEVEVPVGVWQVEKSVQTDAVEMTHHKLGPLSEEARPGRRLISASNPSYSEENLCRIEHAPLDGFPFPQARGQQSGRTEPVKPSSAVEPEEDLTRITIRADINYQGCKDVTVV